MKIYRWKFLNEVNGKIKSANGDLTWQIGKWKTHKGKLKICKQGLHCSKGVYQAFSYIQGEILAEVECDGRKQVQDDKEVYSKMRIVRAYKWQKKDSVELAIYAARLVLKYFEKKYPKDKQPRKAIEAAEKYVKNPTEKNRLAARAAAGDSAGAVGAAWAARAAGDSARAAGAAARDAARDAAWAAGDAARAALISKISIWMNKRVSKLEKYK